MLELHNDGLDKEIIVFGRPMSPLIPLAAVGAGGAALYFFVIKPKLEEKEKAEVPTPPTAPVHKPKPTDILGQAKQHGTWKWIDEKVAVPKKMLDKSRINYIRYHYLGGKADSKNWATQGLHYVGTPSADIRRGIYNLIVALAMIEGPGTEPKINKTDWRWSQYSWLKISGAIIRHLMGKYPKFKDRKYYAGELKGKKWSIPGKTFFKWLANDWSGKLDSLSDSDKKKLAINIIKNNYYNFMWGAALLEEVRDGTNWIWTVCQWKTLKDRGTSQLEKIRERSAIGTFGKDNWDKKLKKYCSMLFKKGGILDVVT